MLQEPESGSFFVLKTKYTHTNFCKKETKGLQSQNNGDTIHNSSMVFEL